MKSECIFCQIVRGKEPSHKIWEDDKHLAFLSIFPNTEGFSIVITKQHYPSYAFDLPDDVFVGLSLAAKTVGKLLDDRLDDVGRTGLIFEGFGVNHVHAKLFPMHGTKAAAWRPILSKMKKFFDEYPGYISSNGGRRARDVELSNLAQRIRK